MHSDDVTKDDAEIARILARFGADERLYWETNRILGVPQHAVARYLHWTVAKAERTRKRVDRRLRAVRSGPALEIPMRRTPDTGGSSLSSAFYERLPSGRRVWSLSRSDDWMCPHLPIGIRPFFEEPMSSTVSSIDLAERLEKARRRLSELVADRDQHDRRVRDLRGALADAEAAEREERELALIEGRDPNGKVLTKPQTLTSALHSALATFHTTAGACERARCNVESLEGEISASRRQRVLDTVRPMIDDLFVDLNAVADKALAVYRTMQDSRHPPLNLQPFELFGGQTVSEGAPHLHFRVMMQLVQYIQALSQYDADARKKLEAA